MMRGESSDQMHLLRSNIHKHENGDELESPLPNKNNTGVVDLLKHSRLDKGFSSRRLSFRRLDRYRDRDKDRERDNHHDHDHHRTYLVDGSDELGDGAPPEWALLLIGCLLGLASGLLVAAFNKGVHFIHEWAWAGTPNEGAAWLRLQKLADTWHRILLIPVAGGVIVGMMHGLLEVLSQLRQSSSSQQQGFDLVAGVFPTIKAIQAVVTLGTGCSLGPEGPSVDIGKSCANGFSLTMENNRERRIALVAAGAASGISSAENNRQEISAETRNCTYHVDFDISAGTLLSLSLFLEEFGPRGLYLRIAMHAWGVNLTGTSFNAAVAGCFFAIETVLRPLRAENSPPFTTAMIILASVISSTVSSALLGTEPAFTVPSYDLKSAAGETRFMVREDVIRNVFTRLVSWFTNAFEFIKEKYGLPAVTCPALGGLGAGMIALKYPGILYWGFTNVNEILHTGKTLSAPGIWLLTQLAAAKVVATALCKGSGLVGGLYAPSLMMGAAVGAVFGGSAAKLTNSAIPGIAAVAQPQAYALVGMAATLASVCSVPLTSVLLLFELTKDYRILLPLMGAVGLAIWVPSVANQNKETEISITRNLGRGYSSLYAAEELSDIETAANHEVIDEDLLLEYLRVSEAMSKKYLKVSMAVTVKEAMKCMHDSHQNCVLVVDKDDLLEGILTYGDIRRYLSKKQSDVSINNSTALDVNTCLVSSVCTRGISYRGQERALLTCYPETNLAIAKVLMEAKEIKQLPVVKSSGEPRKGRKRRIVGVLYYESIWNCLREEINHRKPVHQQRKENNVEEVVNIH
ncbi:chloride channel protein CLC-f-like isoform X1 [Gossypium australe]|uniref:Chloride channel protein n=1 Tax=Gossypium australe TaxID=47621 RepID=A0A5B6VTJ4_9ROSI|nr:chloride channel protein CLC-f-like isoform X1 [Gossypium australe]